MPAFLPHQRTCSTGSARPSLPGPASSTIMETWMPLSRTRRAPSLRNSSGRFRVTPAWARQRPLRMFEIARLLCGLTRRNHSTRQPVPSCYWNHRSTAMSQPTRSLRYAVSGCPAPVPTADPTPETAPWMQYCCPRQWAARYVFNGCVTKVTRGTRKDLHR